MTTRMKFTLTYELPSPDQKVDVVLLDVIDPDGKVRGYTLDPRVPTYTFEVSVPSGATSFGSCRIAFQNAGGTGPWTADVPLVNDSPAPTQVPIIVGCSRA